MRRMRVARLFQACDMRVHDEPIPTPGAGEALVRVTAVGICGSDLHWFAEGSIGNARLKRPLVLGHEFAGVIESDDRRGQRVAVDPLIPCDRCEACREGNPNLCKAQRFAADGLEDGAMREYIAWHARYLHPLPDTLTDEDGAMLEPLGVAIHAVDLAHLRPGMSVGVYGCGPLGLLIIQMVRLCGVTRIIATERLEHREQAAHSFGATVFHADGHESNEILEATNGRGVDVAFEVAGENAAVETAVATAKAAGKVILVGIPSDDRMSFSAGVARRKGLTLKLVRRAKHTYPRAIDLVKEGAIDVRSLVSHHFSLEQVGEAMATAQRREGLKVIVRP